jgi:hypothetical protein
MTLGVQMSSQERMGLDEQDWQIDLPLRPTETKPYVDFPYERFKSSGRKRKATTGLKKEAAAAARQLKKEAKERDGQKTAQQLQDKKKNSGCLKNWSATEDKQLRDLMLPYTGRKPDWAEVASTMAYWTRRQCQQHWGNAANPAIKKGGWTRDEDDFVLQGIGDGKSITDIAKDLSRLPTAVTQRLFGCAGSVNKGLNARRKRNNNGVEELSAKRSRNDVVMVPENELDLAGLFDGIC